MEDNSSDYTNEDVWKKLRDVLEVLNAIKAQQERNNELLSDLSGEVSSLSANIDEFINN